VQNETLTNEQLCVTEMLYAASGGGVVISDNGVAHINVEPG